MDSGWPPARVRPSGVRATWSGAGSVNRDGSCAPVACARSGIDRGPSARASGTPRTATAYMACSPGRPEGKFRATATALTCHGDQHVTAGPAGPAARYGAMTSALRSPALNRITGSIGEEFVSLLRRTTGYDLSLLFNPSACGFPSSGLYPRGPFLMNSARTPARAAGGPGRAAQAAGRLLRQVAARHIILWPAADHRRGGPQCGEPLGSSRLTVLPTSWRVAGRASLLITGLVRSRQQWCRRVPGSAVLFVLSMC